MRLPKIGVRNLAKVTDDRSSPPSCRRTTSRDSRDRHSSAGNPPSPRSRESGSRKAEVHRHQPIGEDGSHGSAVVLEQLLGVGPFSRLHVLQQALVAAPVLRKDIIANIMTTATTSKASPRKKSVIVLLKIYCKPIASLNDLVLPDVFFFAIFLFLFNI